MTITITVTGETMQDVNDQLHDMFHQYTTAHEPTVAELDEAASFAAHNPPPAPPVAITTDTPPVVVPAAVAEQLNIASVPAAPPPPPAPVAAIEPELIPVETVVVPAAEVPGLDSRGHPWDARIHTPAKTKIKDGTWKKVRGVDPAQVAAVEAEFEAAKVAAVPPAVTDVPPAVAAAAASAPAPAPAPAAVAAGVPDVTYATVSSKLNGALQIGKVTPQQMAEMLGGHGVTHMPELAGNLPALAQVDAQLDVILNA